VSAALRDLDPGLGDVVLRITVQCLKRQAPMVRWSDKRDETGASGGSIWTKEKGRGVRHASCATRPFATIRGLDEWFEISYLGPNSTVNAGWLN
jgi:hypothetical protein